MGCQFSAIRHVRHHISPPYFNRRSEGSRVTNYRQWIRKKRTKQSQGEVKQIDVLPDEILLEIFDFYIETFASQGRMEAWQSLVHVCQRWRGLVLGSPRRLDLRLYWTPKTYASDTLDVWPALPLIVEGKMASSSDTDNIIAALGQSNRVCRVFLWGVARLQLEEVLAAIRVPFPELTELLLHSNGETLPDIPDSFLDGSAPRLRNFNLDGIPFPGLPNLLLSATHLVTLWLDNIPHSGYISPEAMVALLSVLSSLKILHIGFQSPQSRPDRKTRRPPPSELSVTPALDYLRFKGAVEYLEDLVTDIDTPQLERMNVTFFNQIDFDTQRLAQFVNRTPKLRKPDVHVEFNDHRSRIVLRPGFRTLEIAISCEGPDWQLSSIKQVCNSSLNFLSTVEVLYIEHQYEKLVWKDDTIENTQWLQLLLPFLAVKNLYLSEEFAPGVAAVLQELVGDRITEVLPNLQNIFVEPSGPFQVNIGPFIAARQLSDHPVAISVWDKF